MPSNCRLQRRLTLIQQQARIDEFNALFGATPSAAANANGSVAQQQQASADAAHDHSAEQAASSSSPRTPLLSRAATYEQAQARVLERKMLARSDSDVFALTSEPSEHQQQTSKAKSQQSSSSRAAIVQRQQAQQAQAAGAISGPFDPRAPLQRSSDDSKAAENAAHSPLPPLRGAFSLMQSPSQWSSACSGGGCW